MEDHSATQEISPGRRAASYWFIDGLQEIVSGLELAIWGGMGVWMVRHLPLARTERLFGAGLAFLLLILLLGWDYRITGFLKAWMTYPRTGYVRPPLRTNNLEAVVSLRQPPDQNVTTFWSRTVVAMFAGNILSTVIGSPWGLPAALSAVALAVYALNRNGERPYQWWSVLFLPLAGLLSMSLGLPVRMEQRLGLVIEGVWLSSQGMATLFCYLRKNPRPLAKEGIHA
jgi:hypothetical protein